MRRFARQLEAWTVQALTNAPPRLAVARIAQTKAMVGELQRLTTLNHLAQVAMGLFALSWIRNTNLVSLCDNYLCTTCGIVLV